VESATAQVETSPGNFQWVYALAKPVGDRRVAEGLIDALVNAGLSAAPVTDRGAGGINRVFRLPVGTNNKRKLGAPHKVRLVGWNPEARYTVAEIAGWLGVDVERLAAGRGVGACKPGEAGDRAMSHPVMLAFGEVGKLLGRRQPSGRARLGGVRPGGDRRHGR
jgi:hypothetical protein